MEHRIEGIAEVGVQSRRRRSQLRYHAIRKRIIEWTDHHRVSLAAAGDGRIRAVEGNRVRILIPVRGVPGSVGREAVAIEPRATHHVRARSVVETPAAPHHQAMDRLPGKSEPGSKIREIRSERSPMPTPDVDLGARVGDAAYRVRCLRIEIFQAVMPLRLAAENVPPQPLRNFEALHRTICILDEGRIVRIGFRGKKIFREIGITVRLTARRRSHADQQ
jgi:hypothetical protein